MSSYSRTREESRLSNRLPRGVSLGRRYTTVCRRSSVSWSLGKVSPSFAEGASFRSRRYVRPMARFRPSVMTSPSVEPSKSCLICNASSLNARCQHIGLSLDSIRYVAVPGWEGCYQGLLGDKLGCHKLLLYTVSAAVFGGSWKGIAYVWAPFGWNGSPNVYQTVSGAGSHFYGREVFQSYV